MFLLEGVLNWCGCTKRHKSTDQDKCTRSGYDHQIAEIAPNKYTCSGYDHQIAEIAPYFITLMQYNAVYFFLLHLSSYTEKESALELCNEWQSEKIEGMKELKSKAMELGISSPEEFMRRLQTADRREFSHPPEKEEKERRDNELNKILDDLDLFPKVLLPIIAEYVDETPICNSYGLCLAMQGRYPADLRNKLSQLEFDDTKPEESKELFESKGEAFVATPQKSSRNRPLSMWVNELGLELLLPSSMLADEKAKLRKQFNSLLEVGKQLGCVKEELLPNTVNCKIYSFTSPT